MDASDDLATLHEGAQRLIEHLLCRPPDAGEGTVRSFVNLEDWAEMVALGWPSLIIPEKFGGFGLPLRYLAAILSLFARHGVSHPLTVLGAEVPALLIRCTSEEQSQELITSIMDKGRVIASALWESHQPFDVSTTVTTWQEDGGGFLLNGVKSPVPYAMLADGFIVLARARSTGEPVLFEVPAGASGLEVNPLPTATGAPTGMVRLTNVKVDDSRRLKISDVHAAVSAAIDIGAALTSAELTVAAMRALELTLDYVKVRKQFGKALGEFQVVHHHCADMYRDVEAMRIVTAPVLRGQMDAMPLARDVSVAKAHSSHKSPVVLEMAHQLHGGVGFYADYPLELIYRRMIALQGEYGSSRWHRARITQLLRVDSAPIGGSTHGV